MLEHRCGLHLLHSAHPHTPPLAQARLDIPNTAIQVALPHTRRSSCNVRISSPRHRCGPSRASARFVLNTIRFLGSFYPRETPITSVGRTRAPCTVVCTNSGPACAVAPYICVPSNMQLCYLNHFVAFPARKYEDLSSLQCKHRRRRRRQRRAISD